MHSSSSGKRWEVGGEALGIVAGDGWREGRRRRAGLVLQGESLGVGVNFKVENRRE